MAIAVYGAGTIASLCADYVALRRLGPDELPYWASGKSLAALGAVSCLLGLDSYIFRNPDSLPTLKRFLMVQVPGLAVLFATVAWISGYSTNFVVGWMIAVATSIAALSTQVFRAVGPIWLAQLCSQAWRLSILLVLFTQIGINSETTTTETLFTGSLISAGICLALIGFRRNGFPSTPGAPWHRPAHEVIRVSLRLWITSLTLVVSLYAEQLAVASLADQSTSADYFAHTTAFIAPSVALSGIIGFFLAPWFRADKSRASRAVTQKPALCIGVVIGAWILFQVLGGIAWIMFTPIYIQWQPHIWIAMSLSALCVLGYGISSAFNGTFAQRDQLDQLVAYQLGALAAAVLVALLLLRCGATASALIAVGALTNHVLRTILGCRVMFTEARRHECKG